MTTPMKLSLAITADAAGVAPATAEARREIEAVKVSTSSLSGVTGGLTAANDEASRAAQRLTQTLRGQGAAEKQLRDNMRAMSGATRINTANIAAQFQDIAVSSSMGMSPLQIALQQGTQLSAVLGPMGAAGAARSLGAALLSVVNPVSLLTLGVVGLSAAAIQYFSDFLSGADDSEEALERQADLINKVAKEWGGAAPALKAYVDELNRAKAIEEAVTASEGLAGNEYAAAREQVKSLTVDIADLVSTLQQSGADTSGIVNLQNDFNDLTLAVDDATSTGEEAKRVQEELLNLFAITGIPVLADYAAKFGDLADQIKKANAEAQEFRVLQDGATLIGPIDPATGRPRTSTLSGINPIDGFNRTPFQTEEEIMFQRGRRVLAEEEEKRRAKALTTGGSVAADPYRDIMKSADDRIAQMQVEIGLIGEVGSAAAALRYEKEPLA